MKKRYYLRLIAAIVAIAAGVVALSCSPLLEVLTDAETTILELEIGDSSEIELLGADPGAKVATSWDTGYYAWVRGFDQNRNRVAVGGGSTYQANLTWNATKGKWTGYMDLSSVSGTIYFLAVVFTGANQVAYQGWTSQMIEAGAPPSTMTLIASDRFEIGNLGPAGGKIFYDKGSYSDSWRYLELCPSESSGYLQWASSTSYVSGSSAEAVGTGLANTETIIASGDSSKYPAAWYCSNLDFNGIGDWFLPSRDELAAARTNLGSGGFTRNAPYWSSSERTAADGGTNAAYYLYNPTGTTGPALKTNGDLYVKAARRF